MIVTLFLFMQEVLFELIRNELWRNGSVDISLTDEEVSVLFKSANKQAVSGLIINSLLRNNASISKTALLRMLSLDARIKQTNKSINDELVRFALLMDKNNIEYFVVKGQTVAVNYPDSLQRMPGDVDFYCDSENYNRAKVMFEEILGCKIIGHSAKHVEFKINDVQFEMHSKLTEFSYWKHNKYWEGILKEDIDKLDKYIIQINGTGIPVLSPTLNTLYLFCHIFYHLIINGIGLRQFCDLALYLNRYKDNINKEDLDNHLRKLGIKKVFVASGYILIDILGLPEEDFPYVLTEKDRVNGKRILDSVMTDGNWAMGRHTIRKKGFLHSLETGCICLKQSMKYIDMAPMETIFRMPKLGEFFIWKLFNRANNP